MANRSECPVCGTNLRAENLAGHLREVHPGKASATDMRQAERAARPGASEERTRRVKKGLPLWLVPFTVILVIFVVLGALIYLNVQTGAPPTLTPVTEMCVTHSGVGSHIHAQLRIALPSGDYPIPANIATGIAPDTTPCMRPVHTHDTTGTIHIEGPTGRTFTLGDFFTVWGQPFSSTQILSYQDDGTRHVTMTVNDLTNIEYGNLVLVQGQTIVITYG